ncbi:endonuclease/exonuclease/phosphatase family protein [Haloactinopolyspora alba]|uniref:Endonuclease/exonuclease/phosphatase family protein n=1 Tax=Haloactinopolyspora alba TaxID=648780 RepID=A0A2P8DN93_9ACTN|nr:endonuclease/exonuclease/phosphatase family protein [Haloactinopolyspora alba]PSK98682.1 endonuclease/exonuclease/phosphatase family protein [Haloactinopolyspora alba]
MRITPLLASLAMLTAAGGAATHATPAGGPAGTSPPGEPPEVRVATYNASLNRASEGELVRDLSTGDDPQARAVAEVIQHTRPDVLLLNEFDHVPRQRAVDLFRENYLEEPQRDAEPIDYPYAYTAPSNTGVPSGFDLNNDGTVGGGDDALGFGAFPGQYGMVVLSRYPIETGDVRTFRNFRWRDMPGALLPDDPSTPRPADWYSPAELDVVRLSSKSHWDVPVRVGSRTVHVLASHPTPPTFDGPEDRNGLRNHDEIRFWADYVRPGRSSYIYDDDGVRGGLRPGASFVVMGDQNSDPLDGDSVDGAIGQLLDHPRMYDPLPMSDGAAEAARLQGGANDEHRGDPRYDTADFADDPAPGNLRVDYVLPSRQLRPAGAGVFWPERSDPLSELTGEYPFPTSDHRLVWADLRVPR